MSKLSPSAFNRACQFISQHGRPLEQAICRHHFQQADPESVLSALKQYQNPDGGFGHGLESDFRLPDSSPMATSVAFQTLLEFKDLPSAQELIRAAISYLEASYDPQRQGWYALPPSANAHPHAPWWHVDQDTGMSAIDEYWGNPSAELAGYLFTFRTYAKKLDPDKVVEHALDFLNSRTEYESFHEVYCYTRLYKLLPSQLQQKIHTALTQAVGHWVNSDPQRWEQEYLPRPLDFIGRSQYRFGISPQLIQANLNQYIHKLEQSDHIPPTWDRQVYPDGMEEAWDEWRGYITLQALLLLDYHDRLER